MIRILVVWVTVAVVVVVVITYVERVVDTRSEPCV